MTIINKHQNTSPDWNCANAYYDIANDYGNPPRHIPPAPQQQSVYTPRTPPNYPQQHPNMSASMLDLRQINKYISPPYFERSNPLRTSRGGMGHVVRPENAFFDAQKERWLMEQQRLRYASQDALQHHGAFVSLGGIAWELTHIY
jgi:hypothetical protein